MPPLTQLGQLASEKRPPTSHQPGDTRQRNPVGQLAPNKSEQNSTAENMAQNFVVSRIPKKGWGTACSRSQQRKYGLAKHVGGWLADAISRDQMAPSASFHLCCCPAVRLCRRQRPRSTRELRGWALSSRRLRPSGSARQATPGEKKR